MQTDVFGKPAAPPPEKKKPRPKPAAALVLPRISGRYAFKTPETPDFALRVLSLGAGVQSSRLLLGILEGEFGTPGVDAPSCAIFADTGWEPAPVLRWLYVLKEYAEARGFPVHVVTATHPDGTPKNIRTDALATTEDGARFLAAMPLHTTRGDGEPMIMRRQCTRDFKIAPIEKEQRRLLGLKPRQRVKAAVESWQGISTDEMQRMKVNQQAWTWNRYPLVERRESRTDCKQWLAARPYVADLLAKVGLAEVPKSACCGCPYRSAQEWLWLYENDPEGFASAVEFDAAAQGGILGWDRPAYLHRSQRPLADVVADLHILAEEEARQGDFFASRSGMLDECDGICGL